MKKLIIVAAAMLMLVQPVMADGDVRVFSNGNEVQQGGLIIDGRTMVPVRAVFEYLQYTVEWNENTKTAILTSRDEDTVVTLTNGKTTFTVNDSEITPDVPQQIVDGRFMLPLRAVGEAIGAKITWNEETKTATINPNNHFFDINSVDENDPDIQDMPVNVVE